MNPRPSILSGSLRRDAISRLHEIADQLSRPYDEWLLSRRPDDSGLRTVSLALGRSGLAVFYASFSRSGLQPATAREAPEEIAVRLLEESIEMLPSQSMDASFLCGFPGVAWTTEHVLSLLGVSPDDDLNASIDDAILDALRDPTFVPAYDLIDGLAGYGVYALERRGRSTSVPMMSAILDRLETTACPQRVGLSWPSGQMTRTAQGKDVAIDETYFNLGMSHGVPGVIGILSRFASVPEVRSRALRLLAGAVDWLVEQRLPNIAPDVVGPTDGSGAAGPSGRSGAPGTAGAYPDFVAEGVVSEPARLAWCYGDPGVAAALCSASFALERPSLTAFALEVAHAGARRDAEGSGVVDAGICHGSAGVAHIFHRLYRATGDEVCRQAAVTWFGRLLERVEDRPHIAGFPTFCFERYAEGEYIEDPAWLTGAAGVGLVLISALSESLPTWDRALLVDLG